MEASLICSESKQLPFYDCDYKKRIKISAILKITAQLAGKDYTDKGLGHEFLWNQGYVFLLSRISIHIKKYPSEPEMLNSATWEQGKMGAMFMRGYQISVDENVCIDGMSGWIVVNPITRKIIRPSNFPWKMPQLEKKVHAMPIDKIIAESLKKVGSYVVQMSDIDANGHVYNANYADIAMNFLPRESFDRDISNFRINFINEAKLGEIIEISFGFSGNKTIIIGELPEKICFETEFIFK